MLVEEPKCHTEFVMVSTVTLPVCLLILLQVTALP
jgi:hypothetical protein